MENQKVNKEPREVNLRINWSYVYYLPYIILMAVSYLVGASLLCFKASFRRLVRLDENFYENFIKDEKKIREVFKSIFN